MAAAEGRLLRRAAKRPCRTTRNNFLSLPSFCSHSKSTKKKSKTVPQLLIGATLFCLRRTVFKPRRVHFIAYFFPVARTPAVSLHRPRSPNPVRFRFRTETITNPHNNKYSSRGYRYRVRSSRRQRGSKLKPPAVVVSIPVGVSLDDNRRAKTKKRNKDLFVLLRNIFIALNFFETFGLSLSYFYKKNILKNSTFEE